MTKLVVLDTETNMGAVNNNLTNLWCIGTYFPDTDESKLFFDESDHQELQDILDTHTVIMHHCAFDVWVLRQFGYTVDINNVEDTMLMSYCIRPDGTHSLKGLGEYLKVDVVKTEYEDFSQYTKEMGEYCLNDCRATYSIYERLVTRLDPVRQIYSIEKSYTDALIELNHNGVYMNKKDWNTVIQEVEEEASKLRDSIGSIVSLVPGKTVKTKNPRSDDTVCTEDNLELGKFVFDKEEDGLFHYNKVEEYNPASGDHTAWALIHLYGWEPKEFSKKTGKPTVDKNVLGDLHYELARLLCEFSKVNKIVTTYGESLLQRVSSDGRLRGSFNQCITKTGRLSSSKPSLQTVPGRGDIGEQIRNLFISPEGRKLVGCDVDSFQMRILAWYENHCLGDKYSDASTLYNEFNYKEDPDPHQAKADLLGLDRKTAKHCNFGGVFGFGINKFAQISGLSLSKAKEIVKLEAQMNPSLELLKQMVWNATRYFKGYCYDLYGRRGYYPDINSNDGWLKSSAERKSFNFIIQSTEASIIKLWTMYVLDDVLEEGLDAQLILQVHDEVLFECSPEDAPRLCEILQTRLQDSDFLPGLKVTGTPSIGDTWGEIH